MLYHVITIWRLNKKKPTVLIYTNFQYIWIIFGRVMNNFRKWTCNKYFVRLKAVKMFIKGHGLSLQYYEFNTIMMPHKKYKAFLCHQHLIFGSLFSFLLTLDLSFHLISSPFSPYFSPFAVLWILKYSEILRKSKIQLNFDWISIRFMISLEQQHTRISIFILNFLFRNFPIKLNQYLFYFIFLLWF